MIYKTRLSKFDSENPLSSVSELDEGKKNVLEILILITDFYTLVILLQLKSLLFTRLSKELLGRK